VKNVLTEKKICLENEILWSQIKPNNLFFIMIFFQKLFSSPTLMETLGNNLVAKGGKKWQPDYYCEKCDYKCFKKYNWDKHLTTSKHLKETNGNNLETDSGKKWQSECLTCENCNKIYKNRSGLWKHKKICNEQCLLDSKPIQNTSEIDKDELII